MSEAQVIMNREMREERIRQYKNDSFIKGVINIITKISQLSTPKIIIPLNGIAGARFQEIDEQSQVQINYWKQRMEEYILTTYSDIIVTDGKEVSI